MLILVMNYLLILVGSVHLLMGVLVEIEMIVEPRIILYMMQNGLMEKLL